MYQDFVDMDTKIRYVSESSNTSGYSTMSPGPGGAGTLVGVASDAGNLSPASSAFSSSPAQSPASALQTEFSNLILPASNSPQQQLHTSYATPPMNFAADHSYNMHSNAPAAMVMLPQHNYGLQAMLPHSHSPAATVQIKREYAAELRIIEHPVEKFRFRYKSEMHGTHGSLNGANSKRTPKTFPEVELCNFNGHAVIRCSLFQTNLESPHSHQLVVRKDDTDICDPHDLHVSPEHGYIAQFQNMGIIHTAKKFIFEELLKKKMNRLRFELGRDELLTKQIQELHKETEKEAKDMNLNQVRLCFEAFKVEENNTWTRIAAPVYTNPINNRKSAQTGELRICRLSIATGSVSGGDDLILLVEKVSKKNIKVRFYEMNEDEDLVWEGFGKFRESDVHHQYAIVCQTPAYRDKEIDKPVDVHVELVRPSDDERSEPTLTFRYKPRDAVVSRKRRRTCSSATNSSNSASSFSSSELPRTVQEQTAYAVVGAPAQPPTAQQITARSEDLNKDEELKSILGSGIFREMILNNSEDLVKMCPMSSEFDFADLTVLNCDKRQDGVLQHDGTASSATSSALHNEKKLLLLQALSSSKIGNTAGVDRNSAVQRIFKIYDEAKNHKGGPSQQSHAGAANQITNIFAEFAEKNSYGDSIIHEIITNDHRKIGIQICHIISYFKLNELLNRSLNTHGESGLHCACLHDRAHYIRPLLGLGCDPNIQDRRGNTALHIALQEQHQTCIESFLNMGGGLRTDLQLRNDEGLSPLHLAIRQKNYRAAEELLKHDASAAFICNTKDGNNALHMAVLQQQLELVKLILKGPNVGDITKRNAAGYAAIDLAKNLGSKSGNEIVLLLSTFSPEADDNIQVTIKEEISSSSTDDEDDNEPMEEALELITVKEEFTIDETSNDAYAKNLENILNDADKFRQLVKLLDDSAKWKHLAQKSKMQHLLCIWSNATDMLSYVKKKANSIEYRVFATALAEVDKDALQILQTI